MLAADAPRITHNRLRELRMQRGLTLGQVADALGINLMQVWRYERRVNHVPDDMRLAFARFYGVPVDQVFLYPEIAPGTAQVSGEGGQQ